MRDFFKSESYAKYRQVLTDAIDTSTRSLISGSNKIEDIVKTRNDIVLLCWVRDEIPKLFEPEVETPGFEYGSEYDAPKEGEGQVESQYDLREVAQAARGRKKAGSQPLSVVGGSGKDGTGG